MLVDNLLFDYILLKTPDTKIKKKHKMEVYHGKYEDAQSKNLSKFQQLIFLLVENREMDYCGSIFPLPRYVIRTESSMLKLYKGELLK